MFCGIWHHLCLMSCEYVVIPPMSVYSVLVVRSSWFHRVSWAQGVCIDRSLYFLEMCHFCIMKQCKLQTLPRLPLFDHTGSIALNAWHWYSQWCSQSLRSDKQVHFVVLVADKSHTLSLIFNWPMYFSKFSFPRTHRCTINPAGDSRPYTKSFYITRTEKSSREVGGTNTCHFPGPSVVFSVVELMRSNTNPLSNKILLDNQKF